MVVCLLDQALLTLLHILGGLSPPLRDRLVLHVRRLMFYLLGRDLLNLLHVLYHSIVEGVHPRIGTCGLLHYYPLRLADSRRGRAHLLHSTVRHLFLLLFLLLEASALGLRAVVCAGHGRPDALVATH